MEGGLPSILRSTAARDIPLPGGWQQPMLVVSLRRSTQEGFGMDFEPRMSDDVDAMARCLSTATADV